MRWSVEIKLSEAERSELERLARGRKVWRALSDRAHIVLLAAEGLTNVQIANTLGINNLTARKWRNRFAEHGMDGLQDEPDQHSVRISLLRHPVRRRSRMAAT